MGRPWLCLSQMGKCQCWNPQHFGNLSKTSLHRSAELLCPTWNIKAILLLVPVIHGVILGWWPWRGVFSETRENSVVRYLGGYLRFPLRWWKFSQSFNRYLLSAYHVPASLLKSLWKRSSCGDRISFPFCWDRDSWLRSNNVIMWLELLWSYMEILYWQADSTALLGSQPSHSHCWWQT